MILVDYIGHMVSTDDEKELHDFARRLGLKRSWYQDKVRPHYDLTTNGAINRARRRGAELVTPQALVRRAWWNKRKGEQRRKRNQG